MSRMVLEPGVQRLSAFSWLQTLVGVGIVWAWIDFDLFSIRWWKVALYAAATLGAAMSYDISENRRVGSNMEGLLFLPALFLLSPVEVIMGRLVGGYLGCRYKSGIRSKIFFTFSAQLMVIAAIAAVIENFFPARDLATVAIAQVALAGFIVLGIYEVFVPVWTSTYCLGELGHVERTYIRDSLAIQVGIVLEFAVGTLVVMALTTSPWMLVPIVAIAGLIVPISLRTARHAVLRNGMDHIVALTRSASTASDPNETFVSVRNSVGKLGAIEDVVIAHIDDADNVTFDPEPGAIIARGAGSAPRLRSLVQCDTVAASSPFSTPGTVGVWRLSETTEDYLVAFSERRMVHLRNFWQSVDILSQHAAVVHTTTSQRRELECRAVEAYNEARTDEPTGRPNRLAAIEWLDAALAGYERIVIVGVRVDGLDAVEQVLGEQAADEDLRAFVAHKLDGHGFEFVARIREEVFVLMKSTTIEEAVHVAECIVSHDDHQADSLRAVAAGVVEVPPNTSADPQSLLADCRIALVRAEREDGLKVGSFDAVDAAAARRRFAIAQALPEAIDQGHIFPVFQPQISIATGELLGCEVLARWTHPELGLVSPAEFIEIAEQGNLIEPLTKLMLASACAARQRWTELGIRVQFSVNVSARSLLQQAFIKHMAELLIDVNLREHELTIEITESTIAEDDATTSALELLHTFGAKISIDDFGTGYSAFAYLHRLPVDEVKIDKSMVMALGQERDPTDVVAGLITICHSLGMRVVAEGVETDVALRRLDRLGCDIAQGYFFAKPMPEQQWCAWALAWSRR